VSAVTAWTVVALVAGIGLLVVGAELLVKGAAAVATRLGIAPVIIGLTVVAFGTSAPELAVSVGAGLAGDTDVAFGNVVGSNTANILLILGGSAVVGTLSVTQRIVRLDVPLLIRVSVLTLLLALDNRIGRLDGIGLLAAIALYTGCSSAPRAGKPSRSTRSTPPPSTPWRRVSSSVPSPCSSVSW
jgi:cation:H+ antiporter